MAPAARSRASATGSAWSVRSSDTRRTSRPTKSAAIAAAQELIDLNPGYEIIDLTD